MTNFNNQFVKIRNIIPIICVLFLCTGTAIAQDMDRGFSMLESGEFDKAEVFFKNILLEYPNNKTAKLCYARATGLNGHPREALQLFKEMRVDYPNDFEVKLNYAESLLWNKDFNAARDYYESLLKDHSDSFPAVLGYANTLSNLKEYVLALTYIKQALTINPRNPSALLSRKYMRMGYADQLIKAGKYKEGIQLLKDNISENKTDRESLLNLANAYIIRKDLDSAYSTYGLLTATRQDSILALNGQSLVSHISGKEKTALNKSKASIELLNDSIDTEIIRQTRERYIQSLIWNGAYREAKKEIAYEITQVNEDQSWLLALLATLETYKADFKKSEAYYNRILAIDSTSFDGNLGRANARLALGKNNQAYQGALETLTFYDNQKDALNFIKTIENRFLPSVTLKPSYSFDNGDNEAYEIGGGLSLPLKEKFSLLADYGLRSTNNKVTDDEATSYSFRGGVRYELAPNTHAKFLVGITDVSAQNQNYTELLTEASISTKAIKRQDIEIGYRRDVQNFNTDLLDRQLVQNNFFLNHNLNTTFNLGWYNQYYYTNQNDGNERHLYFTSLYYNLLKSPSLKAGLNYQYITFKDQVPSIYFSPSTFHAAEVFMNLNRNVDIIKPKQWFYDATVALGYQFIEKNEKQSTYRVNARLGYKATSRLLLDIYAGQSNIASTTAAGFKFTEMGIQIKWLLKKKPFFQF